MGLCCGGLGVPLGLAGWLGVLGVALSGGLSFGLVYSGGRPLQVPVRWPLRWQGLSPGGEGVVVGCAVVFPAASSVGTALPPRVGAPSFPCVVSGGWLAWAGVVRTASGSWSCGVRWGRAPPGVVRCPPGVGQRGSLRCGTPFLCVGPGARRCVLFPCV